MGTEWCIWPELGYYYGSHVGSQVCPASVYIYGCDR